MRRVCGYKRKLPNLFFLGGGKTRPFTAAPHREGLRSAGSAFCFPLLCANMLLRRTDSSNREHHRAAHGGRAVPTSRVLWDMLFGRTFPQGIGYAAFAHRSCLHMCCTATMPHPTERYVQTVSFGEHEVFYCICASSSDDNSNRPVCLQIQRPSRARTVSHSQ